MQIGTQLIAPEGFDGLCKDTVYHFLRSDSLRERVMLVEFRRKTNKERQQNFQKEEASVTSGSSMHYRPLVHFLSRSRFEYGIEAELISVRDEPDELPPWFGGLTVQDIGRYLLSKPNQKRSHQDRIDQTLVYLWPLVNNVNQILQAEFPDRLINSHARSCKPVQHETRLRTAFYAYLCFGMQRLALHYAAHQIGRWDRLLHTRKFGRPSRINGSHYGFGSNDPKMIEEILEGYRRYAGAGQHMSRIYHLTLTKIFGCVVQKNPNGMRVFVHPSGHPFPSLGQFIYRVAQVFPLEQRQIHKYGYTRVRNRLTHSQGRFAESVGNLMERTEQDAYCCEQVAVGYLPGSHLPALWVARIRCMVSGMIVGIGFSVGAELASAYRMAWFCAAIDKVLFAKLFGMELKTDDWPSIGISPHLINDRGPGSTAKADPTSASFMPTIKEAAPSYAGQSKASIETKHPKRVKLEGKPSYKETRATIPQLAVQEIFRVVIDNNSTDISDRLNNKMLTDVALPTPVESWKYFNRRGRNHALAMTFEQAVRVYLDPIELVVRDDGIYFHEIRYSTDHPSFSVQLQKAHSQGRFRISGYMFSACVRHLWIEIGAALLQVDAMLNIRDGNEQLYISFVEAEQLAQVRKNGQLRLKSSRPAVNAEFEEMYRLVTGQTFDHSILKFGRSRRRTGDSLAEAQQLKRYLHGNRGKK
jgi:hypothetical protein